MIKPYLFIGTKAPDISVPVGTASITGLVKKTVVEHNPVPSDGGWYGRAMTIIRNKIVILTYNEGYSHPDPIYERHHIRFSDDYGTTWSDEDKYLDGTSISGFPMYPVNSGPGDARGTSEIYSVLCPNGDIIAHMWASNYAANNDGSHFTRSTDGGLNWTTPVKLTSVTDYDGPSLDTLLGGEQAMTLGNDIYYCMRDFRNSYGNFQNNLIIKSSDNGVTWSQSGRVTNTGSSNDGGKEMSLTYIGGTNMIGWTRWFPNATGRKCTSDDMGATWTVVSDSSTINTGEGFGRSIIKQRSLLKNTNKWWLDPVLIMSGFVHQTSGSSTPRRNCIWVSVDFGTTWSKPIYLEDTDQYDGGYGDIFYNPQTDEYVVITYYAPTDYRDGSVVQYNFKIVWS